MTARLCCGCAVVQGWTLPLYVAAYIRRVGGDTYAESQHWMGLTAVKLIQHTMSAAMVKLLLFCCSGCVVLLAGWLLLLMPLGSHSLLGWAWATVRWWWAALVHRPRHSVQVGGGGRPVVGVGGCSKLAMRVHTVHPLPAYGFHD